MSFSLLGKNNAKHCRIRNQKAQSWMQNAKKRLFILAAEVCREASRIVKNCEEKKTPLCEHSGV